MVLIKENHLACAGGVESAIRRVEEANRSGLKVEVETTNLEEVEVALAAGADRIMLDNMSLSEVRAAVRLIASRTSRPQVEVSGGVTLDSVRELAEAGADYISVGALTHSAPALDLSLRICEVGR
jgi:nicotinate-nucleotide pyrophosphorylase (carboxylating)